MGAVGKFTIATKRRGKAPTFFFALAGTLWYNKPSNVHLVPGEDYIGKF